jgi:hypothetical protein
MIAFFLGFLSPVIKWFSPVIGVIGPLISKILLYIMLAAAVLFLFWYLDPFRAKAAQYQAQVVKQQADAKILAARNAVIIQQLTADAVKAQAQAVRYVVIKRNIDNAPHTSSCSSSPAVRALLDGLRVSPSAVAAGQ